LKLLVSIIVELAVVKKPSVIGISILSVIVPEICVSGFGCLIIISGIGHGISRLHTSSSHLTCLHLALLCALGELTVLPQTRYLKLVGRGLAAAAPSQEYRTPYPPRSIGPRSTVPPILNIDRRL